MAPIWKASRLLLRQSSQKGLCKRYSSTALHNVEFVPPQYVPPLQPGVLPVYDEALKLLRANQLRKREQIEHLRTEAEQGGGVTKQVQIEIDKLEVESEISDPEVRWRHRNGLSDLSKPVYRHLRNQDWRHRGGLDRLMERVHQMHIIPDLIPSMQPMVDLEVRFSKEGGDNVEPGIFLQPEQTLEAPEIITTVFHGDERLYTLVMIDPDVPDVENHAFTNFVHWLVPNITISPLTPNHTLPAAILPYIPPHPQHGTPYHRYTIFLLPQSMGLIDFAPPARLGFSLRDFIRSHGLQGEAPADSAEVIGGGVHLWREIWDEKVGEIYKSVFGIEEPRYGKPKLVDPYLNEDGVRPRKYY